MLWYGKGERKVTDHENFPYEIRWMKPEEWDETMEMVWRTFMKFEAVDYSAEGIKNFYAFLHDGELHRMYREGKYPIIVALDQGKVVGEVSARNGNFVSLLFVEEAYHGQGIGSELLRAMGEFMKKECHEIFMTVKAAPYAVGFYRKQGFRISRPEEQIAGIRVTPMEKFL